MPQPQQNLSLTAPAFQGINTEDSPLSQDITFAARANNAVIDELGRLGSRRGFNPVVNGHDISNITPPTHDAYTVSIGAMHHSQGHPPVAVAEFSWYLAGSVVAISHHVVILTLGTDWVVVCDELGAASSSITTNSMEGQFVRFGEFVYLFAEACSPLLISPSGVFCRVLKDEPGFIAPQDDSGNLTNGDVIGDIACSAYGRLWVSGVANDHQTIWYSDLENPTKWYDGKATPTDSLNTGGALNVSQYWPNGYDEVQAIAAHNNMLIVFGRNSILLYGNPIGDPAAVGGIYLQDAIAGFGLVSRDAVCSTGSDILFVDDAGVRSLGRSIQEQSAPIGDLTMNVRTEIERRIGDTANKRSISLAYWPTEALAICNFSEEEMCYVIDLRRPSSTGGNRITTWSNVKWRNSVNVEESNYARILMGGLDGAGFFEYHGNIDFGSTEFTFAYQSNPLSLGDSVRQKFPKRVDVTVASRNAVTDAKVLWGFGGNGTTYSKSLSVDAILPSFWGTEEWGTATYGRGPKTVKRYRVNTKGSGALVTLGVDATINGGSFSLQELNIQLLLGRIY